MAPALYRNLDDPAPAVRAFTQKYRKTYGIDVNYLGDAGYTCATLTSPSRHWRRRQRPDAGQLHHRDGEHAGVARYLRRTGDCQPNNASGQPKFMRTGQGTFCAL
jgi:hypothetical protein